MPSPYLLQRRAGLGQRHHFLDLDTELAILHQLGDRVDAGAIGVSRRRGHAAAAPHRRGHFAVRTRSAHWYSAARPGPSSKGIVYRGIQPEKDTSALRPSLY